ncbi:MAG: hypothetical protein NTX50_11550 [Candidatus Sumerlaeota bacterium]|nr:hypothetical protein [Candidatus Sumerlaeota bacterium]
MSSPLSKEFVIDTDIVTSAGETDDPISSACREFLMSIYHICHRIILTDELDDEWNRHQSRFTVSWRGSMARRRKINRDHDCPENDALRRQLSKLNLDGNELTPIMKDIHLLDAALHSNKRIASKDDAVRRILRRNIQRLHSIKSIIWVNPAKKNENPLQWLQQGAPDDDWRALGHEEKN